jgi:hypothetical protein
MRRFRVTITGFALALCCAGCGDNPPDSGPVDFNRAQPPSDAILKLREQMSKNAKGGAATTNPVPIPKAAEPKKN